MNEHPCPQCGQNYALVNNGTEAAPGYRTRSERIQEPVENVWGERVGGSHIVSTSTWVTQGPKVQVTTVPMGTDNVAAWPCPCGGILQHKTPATERVSCTHGAAPGGVCRVRGYQVALPTARPRHSVGACPCCGRQGTHEVRLDRQGILPRCLTP